MWFWRGTQSAIFYYATCSPCMEYNHKRKRRKEARAAATERAALELSQPDMIRQPMAFTTNRYWAEEIEAGPGPPKGRRRDSLAGDLAQTSGKSRGPPKAKGKGKQKSVFATTPPAVTFAEPAPGESAASGPAPTPVRPPRPSMDQKPSTFDTLKETLRSSLSPETWNWKRYEREDEPLWGLNDAMSRMWDRARPSHHRSGSTHDPAEHRRSFSHGRRRAGTGDSDRYVYDYSRARHPEVNDLHPPVVSQLPATTAEVAWMLQPPPSRAVMEGKIRPGAEDMSLRRPLAAIGTSTEEDRRRALAAKDKRGITERIGTAAASRATARQPPRGGSSDRANDKSGEEGDVDDDDGEEEEEEEEEEEPEMEEARPLDLKPARSVSLPPIDRVQPLSKTALHSSERPAHALPRPPLAVIASTKTTGAIRTFTVPASAPGLGRRSPSPTSTYMPAAARKAVADTTNLPVPPEWDYLLKLCLPHIPPRTRSSLPSSVCL